jgi:hypothetical protein
LSTDKKRDALRQRAIQGGVDIAQLLGRTHATEASRRFQALANTCHALQVEPRDVLVAAWSTYAGLVIGYLAGTIGKDATHACLKHLIDDNAKEEDSRVN